MSSYFLCTAFDAKSLLARCEHWSGLLRAKAFVDDDERPASSSSNSQSVGSDPSATGFADASGASPMRLDDELEDGDEQLTPVEIASDHLADGASNPNSEDFSPSAWPSVGDSSVPIHSAQ